MIKIPPSAEEKNPADFADLTYDFVLKSVLSAKPAGGYYILSLNSERKLYRLFRLLVQYLLQATYL